MKIFLSITFAALIALPVSAASPKKPKNKSRTLAQTIEFVKANGRDVDMNPRVAGTLGYPAAVHTWTLTYKSDVTPDQRSHMYTIVYDAAGDKKVPTALVWFVSRIEKKDAVNMLDGYVMKMDANGKLLSMAHGQGEAGKVVQTPRDLDSTETKKVFDDETRFYTNTAIGLPFTK